MTRRPAPGAARRRLTLRPGLGSAGAMTGDRLGVTKTMTPPMVALYSRQVVL